MPIQNQHPLYAMHVNSMQRTKDAYTGCVTQYVPKLSNQTTAEYEAYVNRSSYFNVVERTVSALIGALTRRPHTFNTEVQYHGDITSDEFVSMCYHDLMLTGRSGILIDIDDNGVPYLVNYCGMSIINWSDRYVILQETYYEQDPRDAYNQLLMTRYRELFIDSAGFYAVNVWEQKKNRYGGYNSKPVYEITETFEPQIRGKRLDVIPFVVANPSGIGISNICKPVLSTLADINIDHFKISVDIGHGAHFIALPTPYVAGDLAGDQTNIRVGTDQIIHLQQGSTIGYLEFNGNGMKFLQELAQTKEEQMYGLGSRLLQYKRGVESSDSLQIRLGAEGASLVRIASALEEALEIIISVMVQWQGSTTEVEVELNKDVSPTVIDPGQVQSLLALYQQNVISIDTLLQRLYEGEIVDDPISEQESTVDNGGEQ